MKYTKILIVCLLIFSQCHVKSQKPNQKTTPLTVTGHRGAAGSMPENTLASLKHALALKVDRIEVDVQQTKDSVVVLMHDKTLQRTTNGSGRIKNHSYAQLLTYQIEDSLKIPSLEEALITIDGQAQFVIEIKEGGDYYPGIEENVLKLIDEYNAESWCIIQSFSDEVLEKVHSLNPGVRLHKLLLSSMLYDFEALPYVSEYSINYHFTSAGLVEKIHAMGKKINCWTVNDRAKMAKLRMMKVDGVITDFPERVKD